MSKYEKARDEVIAKAWKDPAFRKKLAAQPRETLKEYGIDIPQGVQVRIQQDDSKHLTFVLPPAPSDDSELKDAQLRRVSGGSAAVCQRHDRLDDESRRRL